MALVLSLIGTGCLSACVDHSSTKPPGAIAGGGGSVAPGAPPASLVYDRADGDHKHVYLNPDGGGAERRLTEGAADDMLPRWTPDGRSIVFSSGRSRHSQLLILPAEGGVARPLRTNPWTEWQADPSPDGGTLAFLSNRGGFESLWLMEISTGKERCLVRQGRRTVLGNPHFSPDGTRIVFSSNVSIGHQIFVVDLASGRETRLTGLLSGGCEPASAPT